MAQNTNDYAIVVGVSHYEKITTLSGPENDALEIQKWLLDPQGGNIPEANCHMILSTANLQHPVQQDIDSFFNKILNKITKGEKIKRRLYFYFSGHGIGIDWQQTALVLPAWTEFMRNCALSASEYLNTIVEFGQFYEVFFFIDCCRNRMLGVRGAFPGFAIIKPNDETAKCNSFGFFATEFDNKAFEAINQPGNGSLLDNNHTRGLFTVCLLNGLRGGAADLEGRVTVTSLVDYLTLHLPKLAGEHKKRQNPKFQIVTGGKEVIIVDGFEINIKKLNITFKSDGRDVVLEDPELNIIKNDNTANGSWIIPVKKGVYCIYYADNKKEAKYIRIEEKNIINYEF